MFAFPVSGSGAGSVDKNLQLRIAGDLEKTCRLVVEYLVNCPNLEITDRDMINNLYLCFRNFFTWFLFSFFRELWLTRPLSLGHICVVEELSLILFE